MRTMFGYVGAMLLCVGSGAGAQTIQITPGDCRSGVALVARDARLVDVLKRLAQALGFELRFDGDEARMISVNATKAPADLIASLSAQDSIVVTQAKDPKCPWHNRVVKVWVLPSASVSAGERAAPVARPSTPSQPPARAVVREQVIRGPELDEQSRRAKAAYDEYVRIHGVPPPGAPEEIGKP